MNLEQTKKKTKNREYFSKFETSNTTTKTSSYNKTSYT